MLCKHNRGPFANMKKGPFWRYQFWPQKSTKKINAQLRFHTQSAARFSNCFGHSPNIASLAGGPRCSVSWPRRNTQDPNVILFRPAYCAAYTKLPSRATPLAGSKALSATGKCRRRLESGSINIGDHSLVQGTQLPKTSRKQRESMLSAMKTRHAPQPLVDETSETTVEISTPSS